MDKINQIFSEKWAIRQEDYHRLLGLIIPSINAGNLTSIEKSLTSNKIGAYAATPYVAQRWELEDASLPQNSIVVLSSQGVLYSWDTNMLEYYINLALANTKIAGIVLYINGPGGMISRVDLLEILIKKSPKPIAAYITGCCASAHFWFASACGRTFISSPLDQIGSVGIVYTYSSFKKYYQENGIEMKDIYPDSADLKNKMVRDMDDKGDDTAIKENLKFLHGVFARTVATNLGISYDPELPLFRGQIFYADVAVANGYIDQFGTLDDAMMWVTAQAANKVV